MMTSDSISGIAGVSFCKDVKGNWAGIARMGYKGHRRVISMSVKKYGWYQTFVYSIKARRDLELEYRRGTDIPEIGFLDTAKLFKEAITNYVKKYPELREIEELQKVLEIV